jgi:hypothetical protein
VGSRGVGKSSRGICAFLEWGLGGQPSDEGEMLNNCVHPDGQSQSRRVMAGKTM